jgi:hypothetical protein
LKAGEEPRRGGPKENQDDELNNELKALEIENKQEKNNHSNSPLNNNNSDTNINIMNNRINKDDSNQAKLNSLDQKNYQYNHKNTNVANDSQTTPQPDHGNVYKNNTDLSSQARVNLNNNAIKNPNVNLEYDRKDPLDLQPCVSQEFPSINKNDVPDRIVHNLSTSVISSHSNLVQKEEAEYINQQFSSILQSKPNLNINTNSKREPNLVEFMENQKSVSNKMPNVNPTVTNLIKPPNIHLPTCKENKQDYDKIIKTILQHIEYGGQELDYQKLSMSINHVEMALFYLRNIKNN